MKKILSVLVLIIISISIVGCEKKSEDKVKEEPAQVNKATDEKEDKKEDIKEMKINEPFHVSTEWGNYEVTMLELKKTDWWGKENNNSDKQVVALTYEINNISFSNEYYNSVYLDASAFKVIDSKGYLNTTTFTVYEGEYPAQVPVGAKHKSTIAFAVDNDITHLDFILTRNAGNEDISKIRFQL